jgi:outer membrane protein OmpA-like peptidoglycan-associated protein
MCQRHLIIASSVAFGLVWTCSAHAQEAQAGFSLQGDTDQGVAAAASGNARPGPDAAYGPPWGTAPMSFELGVYWGAFIPSKEHELYDADRASINYQRLEYVTPELGLRLAWFPHEVFGIEAEGGLLPSQTRQTDQAVSLWTARGHVIVQAPTKTIVPFILGGGGVLGLTSKNSILGSDIDGALHFGVGVKGYVSKSLALRLDGRGTVANGYGADTLAIYWEGLLGASVVLGRPEPPPPPPDSDGDGVIDQDDQCPQLAGVPPLGCPPPPPDEDGDGVPDPEDRCPGVAGVASEDPEKNGCPLPPPDGDGDGVPDADDKCPSVVGDGPDGCLQDTDGDHIPNRDDKCPDQPETRNGYEDEDGCPDDLPEQVKRFTGAIKGIIFESGKAVIRPESFATLNEAAKVLAEYQAVRVEISGHTDTTGTLERNMVISKERAEAVKTYLTGRGIAADRIETRGVGPNEPVADNKTKTGRALNRRIEFKLIQKPEATDAALPAPAPGAPADAPPAPESSAAPREAPAPAPTAVPPAP